ncbi:MAG TPA: hypothetical protein K8W03_07315 [Bifidobacterium pseudolongum subsp. globosum]|nr:hypothetical protein [Bifidobacterium pseudolongum subsp. globosum]
MTTTPCAWSVDWNQCANCARLKKRVDDAHAALLAASERVDQAYDEYRDVRDAGHVAFGTPSHRAWQARLDNLEQQVDEASAASQTAIDEWAKSIRLHHRFHMAYTRIAAAGHVDTGETTSLPETEEMEEVPTPTPLIRADKLMGILDRDEAAYKVTIGFCDLWDLDASDLHAQLATIQTIRTQLERLIDEAKENTNA